MRSFRQSVRKSAIGSWVADYLPCRESVMGQPPRWIPRRLAVVNRRIEANSGFLEECRATHELYDGGDFMDVGAHIGSYCLILAGKAKPGARFIAVEPEMISFSSLQANLGMLSRIHPDVAFSGLFCAIGDGRFVEFAYPMGRDFHPQVRSSESGTGQRTVKVDTLVNALSLKPTLIKVDVEGAEFFVLQGMGQTLRKLRPRVMLEFHPYFQPPGVTEADCSFLLASAGYLLARTMTGGGATRQFWNPPAPSTATQV